MNPYVQFEVEHAPHPSWVPHQTEHLWAAPELRCAAITALACASYNVLTGPWVCPAALPDLRLRFVRRMRALVQHAAHRCPSLPHFSPANDLRS